MLTFVKAVRSSDGKTFDKIEEAQAYELGIIARQGRPLGTEDGQKFDQFCATLVENREKVLDILSTKEGSLPRARAINGGRKTRKPKTELTPTSETPK